jgi:hypothetical protein
VNEPILQVDDLSLAHPEHRGRSSAPILDDVSITWSAFGR